MHNITVKYAGTCRKCGAELPTGAQAVHEKHVGIFCMACAPTGTEEIRQLRQEAADKRADQYEEWAEKRNEKAAALVARNEPFRGDYAFNTQPGHIPERARVIAREEKAYEHANIARSHEAKAASLRHGVRVAGDAERRHDAQDEAVRAHLAPGMMADWMGRAFKVLKVNRKSATLASGYEGGAPFRVELHLLTPIVAQAQ